MLEELAREVGDGEGARPDTALRAALTALGADAGALAVTWDGEDDLELLATAGIGDELSVPSRMHESESRLMEPILARRPLVAERTGLFDDVDHRFATVVRIPLLRIDDERSGVLAIGFTKAVAFTLDDATFFSALGRIISHALDRHRRARLHDHLVRLQKLTSTLAEALTRDEVARAIVREGTHALDADMGAVALLNDGMLELVAHKGFTAAQIQRVKRFPLDAAYPLAAAARSQEPILLESRDECLERFPGAPFAVDAPARSALPLIAGEKVLGAVGFVFADPRTFDVDDREIMQTLADLCAQALDRADVIARERREQAEREFIDNAAHELRTPLAAIASAVEALQLGAKDKPATRDALLAGIEAQVDRLTRLSHALLMLARAQADPNAIPHEDVSIGPLVAEIARTLETRPGVRVVLDCQATGIVRSEHTLLEAAISNIAGNASRHTDRGEIRFRCADCEDGQLAIEISDTGSGMSEEVRRRALERFYRGESRDGAGFGLGLALAKEMIAVLGGELMLESRPRQGTTVRITLPVS